MSEHRTTSTISATAWTRTICAPNRRWPRPLPQCPTPGPGPASHRWRVENDFRDGPGGSTVEARQRVKVGQRLVRMRGAFREAEAGSTMIASRARPRRSHARVPARLGRDFRQERLPYTAPRTSLEDDAVMHEHHRRTGFGDDRASSGSNCSPLMSGRSPRRAQSPRAPRRPCRCDGDRHPGIGQPRDHRRTRLSSSSAAPARRREGRLSAAVEDVAPSAIMRIPSPTARSGEAGPPSANGRG